MRSDGLPVQVERAGQDRDSDKMPPAQVRHTFAELAIDYEFFTPALLTTYGGLDRDVVAEFIAYYKIDRPLWPRVIECPFPIFGNLPDGMLGRNLVAWSRRLYQIDRSQSIKLREFMTGLAWSDPATQLWGRGYYSEIKMRDFIAEAQGRPPAVFPCSIFVASTSNNLFVIDYRTLGATLPEVMTLPPREAERKHRDALFAASFSDSVMRQSQLEHTGINNERNDRTAEPAGNQDSGDGPVGQDGGDGTPQHG